MRAYRIATPLLNRVVYSRGKAMQSSVTRVWCTLRTRRELGLAVPLRRLRSLLVKRQIWKLLRLSESCLFSSAFSLLLSHSETTLEPHRLFKGKGNEVFSDESLAHAAHQEYPWLRRSVKAEKLSVEKPSVEKPSGKKGKKLEMKAVKDR